MEATGHFVVYDQKFKIPDIFLRTEFLKRFSNTEADEMILIIHPWVGLHEVRNVSVIFLSSLKYFIVCEKREKIMAYSL